MNLSRYLLRSTTIIMLFTSCAEPPSAATPIRPVRVMRVGDASTLAEGSLPGRAQATQHVNLSFRVSGSLIDLAVDVGNLVAQGDVIARLDPRDFETSFRRTEADLATSQAQLKAMKSGARPEEIEQLKAAVNKTEARLRTAVNEFARAKKLTATGAMTESEYDQILEERERAEAELRQTREELEIGEKGAREEDIEAKEAEIRSLAAATAEAKNKLSDTRLRSPFVGKVVAKFVENFEDVRSQQQILRLVDASRIEMVIAVPESAIAMIPYISKASCEFDALPDRVFAAEVKEVGIEASHTTRTYPVTFIMDQPADARVLPGMSGRVTCLLELPESHAEAGVEIPEAAVFEREGASYVWIIESLDPQTGAAKMCEVQIGQLSPRGLQNVVATDGTALTGKLVVTAGVNYLSEGQRVRIEADQL